MYNYRIPIQIYNSAGEDPGFYVRGAHFLARGLGTASFPSRSRAAPGGGTGWGQPPLSSWELENIGPLF